MGAFFFALINTHHKMSVLTFLVTQRILHVSAANKITTRKAPAALDTAAVLSTLRVQNILRPCTRKIQAQVQCSPYQAVTGKVYRLK